MELTSERCLINSISRFIHLVTCLTSKTMPGQKNYKNIATLLKLLKPVLDDVAQQEAPSDETICRQCEELDVAINEARELLEEWSPKKSKILWALQSEPELLKVQSSALKLSHILCQLLESSPPTLDPSEIQHFIQELQKFEVGKTSKQINVALEEGKILGSESLTEIIHSLNLSSHEELLNECIALEKERLKAKDNKLRGNLDKITLSIDFFSIIRDCMLELETFKAIDGIKIPPYFRCPLSLELMVNPVIIASGQTYEKASIQKWLDHGLTTCPKTLQALAHSNLIPNYTVKALIENWCEVNKVSLDVNPESTHDGIISNPGHLNNMDDMRGSSETSNSTSRLCHQGGQAFESEKIDFTSELSEELSACRTREAQNSGHTSPGLSHIHSRSESVSSAVSSIDYLPSGSTDVSRISSKHDNVSDTSGEVQCDYRISSPRNKSVGNSPNLSARLYHSSKTMSERAVNGLHNPARQLSLPTKSMSDDLTTSSHVEKLIGDLESQSTEVQTAVAAELRFLAKHNMENRAIIGGCGAIAPLISLLNSDVKLTQEHAVTALLNLSINENIKAMIAEQGALEPLIHVLRTGNAGAKENAAAALFSLSLLEEYRKKIGRSGAVKALVDLLGLGTIRGKKDAATALFNLSIFHENKARIIQAGAVKHLIRFLDPSNEMVDKAVALLANLSTISEGCLAIAREGGIQSLVEIVETGSQRGKENAASILLQLCLNSPKYCRLVLQEGAVPPLVALSQSGSPRAKEKAQQLLSHFRSQREGAAGRGKS
ncbi:U-box domain-containing protein 3 [Capsicum annuum]|uniref:RING-type E3 ubiquitin transferase n=1 Tax=Capsicum annuum TaxID=4072 RepID=A0A1U8G228_CAPAN|nr:U-box domain-containing protein 3 [Capsicum annuum]XP_016565461.1 U-box domain-containing protein 3 [Capsicum annuum]XP_016565462.1 U-box domain-containing protein 3 [Capsicum annuum]XP_016565464.1 U-box domain-containing protein 3 [Capsicum annuum]XP_016565465.1 U-box domain-containing protein 3 [Capsicum annuum]XP_016565466.1 U-box domain-containing protein 3 [Capsicum annuum]XP_016565467.1 U-box domain-containing protein 3 [Capsicum annuum]XP_016565468.1 U-box domain-containing protein